LLKEQKMRDRPALPSPDRPLTTQKTRVILEPLDIITESFDSPTPRFEGGGPSVAITETDVHPRENHSSDSMSDETFSDIGSD